MKNIRFRILLMFLMLLSVSNIFAQIPCVGHSTGILERDTAKRKPSLYKNIREADIAWVKRVYELINFKEKQNSIFSIKQSDNSNSYSFLEILDCAIKMELVKIYADENFTKRLTYNEIISKIDKIEEINLTDSISAMTKNLIIKSSLIINDVVQLKIKEDWIIDKNFNIIDARIIGICPMIVERDTAGDFVRKKPMFWIYFPELRNILVYADIINKANPADKITWDDMFLKRLFKGTVVKESNTKNRNVTDYTSGKDATIESEQLKRTNQDMDQDLKEY